VKIMTVDDSLTMRRILTRVIDKLGHETLEAGDGNEALEALAGGADDVALILLDRNMPNLDGMETLKALKADATLQQIPVIMVTTETERASVVEAIQAGACQYVAKPFDEDTLVAKIRKVLDDA